MSLLFLLILDSVEFVHRIFSSLRGILERVEKAEEVFLSLIGGFGPPLLPLAAEIDSDDSARVPGILVDSMVARLQDNIAVRLLFASAGTGMLCDFVAGEDRLLPAVAPEEAMHVVPPFVAVAAPAGMFFLTVSSPAR